ncbi:MAG: hypothetical protein U1F26_04255 [Lysobacterales bacterium]
MKVRVCADGGLQLRRCSAGVRRWGFGGSLLMLRSNGDERWRFAGDGVDLRRWSHAGSSLDLRTLAVGCLHLRDCCCGASLLVVWRSIDEPVAFIGGGVQVQRWGRSGSSTRVCGSIGEPVAFIGDAVGFVVDGAVVHRRRSAVHR